MVCFLICSIIFQFPERNGYVTDFGDFFTETEIHQLEAKLHHIDAQEDVEIIVVTIKTLNNSTAKDYATHLGNSWQIGRSRKNGIVIVLSKKEKEIFIATGIGLAPSLPSALTQKVIDNNVIPLLKKGDHYLGIELAIESLIQEWKQNNPSQENFSWKSIWIICFILIMLGMMIWYKKLKGQNRRSGYFGDSTSSDGVYFDGDGGGGSYGDSGSDSD